MAAGRKPTPKTETPPVELNEEALQDASQALTVLNQRTEEIATRFGDGEAYERNRVVSEARFFMAQSAEAMLEAGKRLIQIKENEPHGEFIEIVEQRLGLGIRAAQSMMAAAVKYLSPRLAANAQTFAHLGKSKLFELMTEADDDLVELASGGTLAGLQLDDIDVMSVRELKVALRDSKQQVEAKDKVLADRTAKVDALEEKLHKPFKPAKNALARTQEQQAHLDELRAAISAADLAFARVAVAVATVTEESDAEAIVKAAGDGVAYLVARMRDVSNANQLVLDTSDEAFGLKPDWM